MLVHLADYPLAQLAIDTNSAFREIRLLHMLRYPQLALLVRFPACVHLGRITFIAFRGIFLQ